MSFDLSDFKYIISTVEDSISMLDDAKISVSTTIESNEDDPDALAEADNEIQNWIVFKLYFPLKNGFAEIMIDDDEGTAKYYNKVEKLLKEIKFDNMDVTGAVDSFNLALKVIISTDKQNKQSKSTSSVLIEDSEMNKLRTQLSGIN
jgi:hypothetical protein